MYCIACGEVSEAGYSILSDSGKMFIFLIPIGVKTVCSTWEARKNLIFSFFSKFRDDSQQFLMLCREFHGKIKTLDVVCHEFTATMQQNVDRPLPTISGVQQQIQVPTQVSVRVPERVPKRVSM